MVFLQVRDDLTKRIRDDEKKLFFDRPTYTLRIVVGSTLLFFNHRASSSNPQNHSKRKKEMKMTKRTEKGRAPN